MQQYPTQIIALILLSLSATGLWADPPHAVGEVSLVIGEASRQPAQGKALPLNTGDPIRVGDRLRTAANGHLHIRFIDQALVSLRPNSRLLVERYQFDAARPQDSTVKFSMDKGTVRAVSGQAAEAARQRFRLNTPIAAIGVRGTDFVVQASARQVRALVTQGAIVMAPFSAACSPNALTSCDGVQLKADSQQMLEYSRRHNQPQLRPVEDAELRQLLQDEDQVKEGQQDRGASDTANADLKNESLAKDIIQETALSQPPAQNPSAEQLQQRKLVWGRWGGGATPEQPLALSYKEAREGRRIVTGDTRYGLYRQEAEGETLDAQLGRVNFRLEAAQANLSQGREPLQPVRVESGRLGVDFTNRVFDTQLNMNSASTGPISLQANGQVDAQGRFSAQSAEQGLKGAVSLDGSEAAYLFDKQVPQGMVSGLTLWGR
ncbi:FecR domain-containing protein [Magnetovirga frankeli]|uniref:FecR family protein n=1 Tax=Magnetovirga frankeli TaxID=947516 RepID=UPI001AF4E41B|nr:FecR domain-containing protein [gamma proteobacterium SS-5]